MVGARLDSSDMALQCGSRSCSDLRPDEWQCFSASLPWRCSFFLTQKTFQLKNTGLYQQTIVVQEN